MATYIPSKLKRTISTQKVIDGSDIDGLDTADIDEFDTKLAALKSPPQKHQRFTSSGTWTRPGGIEILFVRLHSGGQGGGRKGGKSGQFKQGFVRVSGDITVTVGQGGAGGSGTGAGTNGGASSFGTLITTQGGGVAPAFTSFRGLDMFVPSFSGSTDTGSGTSAGYPGGAVRGGGGSMFGPGGSNGGNGSLGAGGGGKSSGSGGAGGRGFVELIWLK